PLPPRRAPPLLLPPRRATLPSVPRVLVVDDEPGVRESLRLILRGECEVELAASVDEALARLREDPPDLVLLDLVMPGRSGFELLSEIGGPPPGPPAGGARGAP